VASGCGGCARRAYLLGWALRREKRDKPAVLAARVLLLFCAAMLARVAVWRATAERPPQPATARGGVVAAAKTPAAPRPDAGQRAARSMMTTTLRGRTWGAGNESVEGDGDCDLRLQPAESS
jgi:uncharacterized membrane protein YoaK (UPF0700 family)